MKSNLDTNKIKNKKKVTLFNSNLFFLLIFIHITHFSFSQNKISILEDSLKTTTYEELINKFNVNFSNPSSVVIYAHEYLNRAKLEKDSLHIAKGYYLFAELKTQTNLKEAINYCDSVIKFSKNLKNDKYPGLAYLSKGMIYFQLGKYKEALYNYLLAQNYAKKNKNDYQLFYINANIAELKLFWGNARDAKIILLSQLKVIEHKKEFNTPDNLYNNTIFDLSNSYLLTNKLDSAALYVKKGMDLALKYNNKTNYNMFVSQAGIIEFFKKEYTSAIDSLSKILPTETMNSRRFINNYYQGQSYNQLNNNKKAFYYLSKADSIYNITNDVIPEVKDLQQYFVNYYSKKHDLNNQLKYVNRLLIVDSIIDSNRKELSESIITNYDRPKLLAQKQEIENLLIENDKKSTITILSLSGLLLLISILLTIFYSKQRNYKKRFQELISNKEKESELKEIVLDTTKINGISQEVIQHIISALQKFENSNGFLNNSITLTSLAEKLNTNSNYLSKVINHYKNQNFSSYITELRITYSLEKLKNDEKFRKYNILAIANEVGFNNSESFSKAFFKKTGIYPSYFIKQLEKTTFKRVS